MNISCIVVRDLETDGWIDIPELIWKQVDKEGRNGDEMLKIFWAVSLSQFPTLLATVPKKPGF